MANFALEVDRFCKRAKISADIASRKIALELFARVILRTPVDTGRARANWGCEIGLPWRDSTVYVDKDGTAAIGRAAAKVAAWDFRKPVYLSNTLPYIGVLEFGKEDGTPGSRQAPNGMVRVSLAEIEEWVKNALVIRL